jgi:2-iminobutanoate/2-iminopropanoate deaminase
MATKIIATPRAPKAIGPYSQAVLVESSAGRTLYCSGQIAIEPATGELVQGDITLQTERVLENIDAVLSAAGMAFANVVKTTVFLANMADFMKMNELYGKRFKEPFPARSTVQAAGLPRGALVEIEVVAVG